MTQKQLQGLETKKRIIACAYALFRKKGFNSVTVAEIVRAAHSSKGSFYTHFQSKEELLLSMLPMVDKTYLEFESTTTEYETTLQKIAAFAQYVFTNIENRMGLDFISTIYAYQVKDSKTERFLTASQRTYYAVFGTLIDEGKKNGEIKKEIDTKHTIMQCTTLIRGVLYDWCLHKGAFNLAEYGREITEIMLNQIKTNQ